MANKIKMTAVIHPFKTERKSLEFDEGTTIKDMVLYAQPNAAKMRHAIVFINGRVIPKNIWEEHKPKTGELVEVRAFPIPHGGGGGGKDILRVVLMIAVIALSAGAGFGAVAALGLTGGWAVVVGAVVTGIVGVAGMLAVNALCPTKTPSLGSLSGTDTCLLYTSPSPRDS